MWQFGHVAETMSRSREISWAQPPSTAGNGLVWPLWFTFLKQPFAVVHGAMPLLNRSTRMAWHRTESFGAGPHTGTCCALSPRSWGAGGPCAAANPVWATAATRAIENETTTNSAERRVRML